MSLRAKYAIMKKSSKILVAGLFLIVALLAGEALFSTLGLDFGITQAVGCFFAGLAGAFKLVS